MLRPKVRSDLTEQGFLEHLLNDTPMLDVRAPIEFQEGAFPTSSNVPILSNDQRHLIGTEYAGHGQAAAINLGLRLATPNVRAQRLSAWQAFIAANPNGYLYCFRGGLRSKTTQQWLADAGHDYPLIEGGYKALRRFLLDQLERLCKQGNIVVVSGMTGVGKTELIQAHSSAIDIEGLALHRGSAFGKLFVEQPTQINWENQVIIDWLKCEAADDSPVLIEAESHQIGKVHVPQVLQNAMANAPKITLTAPLSERVERIFNDYVSYQLAHFENTEQDPWAALQHRIDENLRCIRKRLGGLRYKELSQLLPNAIEAAGKHQDSTGLIELISILLRDYYDPQYQHHNEKSHKKSVFTGDVAELTVWLNKQ